MSIISLFATYVKYAITIFRYCIIWYNYIVGSILFIRIYKLLADCKTPPPSSARNELNDLSHTSEKR